MSGLAWFIARRRAASATRSEAEAVRRDRFTRRHAWEALFAALPFILRCVLVKLAPLVALGIVLGPMAGPVARDWQDCCRDIGLAVLPWGLGALGLALSTQWLLPDAWGGRLRLGGWVLGLAGWFFCGLVTYLHALE